MARSMNRKNIFRKEVEASRMERLMRYVYPIFYMNEFFYILFIRWNNYILNTTYNEQTSEQYRHRIYSLLILLYFVKPLFAYVIDNVYFSISNIRSYISKVLYEWKTCFQNLIYSCIYTSYKAKYYFFKYLYQNNLAKKKRNEEGFRSFKSRFGKISSNKYIDNFIGLPLNRKSYILVSEFLTALFLFFVPFFLGLNLNINIYNIIIFITAVQMLVVSSTFDGIIVERCKEKVHYEKIFYISYLMCVKICGSLILYYSSFLMNISIYILFLKSVFVFYISSLPNEGFLLLSNSHYCHYSHHSHYSHLTNGTTNTTNTIIRNEDGTIKIKNTTNFREQIKILKRVLINEDMLRFLLFLMIFNSSIDTKLMMLQHGVMEYNWPKSLINYIPLISQVSKLIGIAIFQIYTSKMCYKHYAIIVILLTMFFKMGIFFFLYYCKNKNYYISPIFFLLNIIIPNISIKLLALPILLFCIHKAPLNLEATTLNIYIFCFNLSNLISKRNFVWKLFLQIYQNVYIILLLSFLTTCASLLYCCNISLDSIDASYFEDDVIKTISYNNNGESTKGTKQDNGIGKRIRTREIIREKERKNDKDRDIYKDKDIYRDRDKDIYTDKNKFRNRNGERELEGELEGEGDNNKDKNKDRAKEKRKDRMIEQERAHFQLRLLQQRESSNESTNRNNGKEGSPKNFFSNIFFFRRNKQNETTKRNNEKMHKMHFVKYTPENSEHDEWLILDNLKGEKKREHVNVNSLIFSNVTL